MSMPNLSHWKCRIRPSTNNETKGEHFTVAIYSTLTFWRFLGQIYRSTLQLRALKPEYPMKLLSCRQWAVKLDMSEVKLRNNEEQLFRKETTHLKSSAFRRKKPHATKMSNAAKIYSSMCAIYHGSAFRHVLYTLHSRKRHFVMNIT